MKIIVVGGGIIGLVFSLALSNLSKNKIKINLVEINDISNLKKKINNDQSVAISYHTKNILKKFGIWKYFSCFSTKINSIEISDQKFFGKTKINSSEVFLSSLGYVIQLRKIKILLFKILKKKRNIKLYCPYYPKKIIREKNKNIILLNNGKKLTSKLIVVADGMNSKIAKKCSIYQKTIFYNQIAMSSKIHVDFFHKNCAFEKFNNHGSLAILPLHKNINSLIWCFPKKFFDNIKSLNKKKLSLEIQKIFGWDLGKISLIGKQKYHMLKLSTYENHISHRLALIGNAAQIIHPIAGQGLNLGMRDVIDLSNILIDSFEKKIDYGNYDVLIKYQNKRKKDQKNTIFMTESLINLFSSKIPLIIIIRNLGLSIIERFPFFKKRIIKNILFNRYLNIF
ncbi:ubiH [Wigglesworthia glossinidia endosymbiont of Glossina brevipalpis]|uniref:UbiH protein n=1 Tax=Wigglesworthia glossinidia brevipalpis TaxID=36870 RepID=Q8D2C3_WIGBR|nr:ubiH [Wigglesworthia glossinidia endosymbiont of Glossina brevipalpis]